MYKNFLFQIYVIVVYILQLLRISVIRAKMCLNVNMLILKFYVLCHGKYKTNDYHALYSFVLRVTLRII